MTKMYAWAAGDTDAERAAIAKTHGRGRTATGLMMTARGTVLSRKPLPGLVEDCRALIAGIPWFMRIGAREYEIRDRSQMKATLAKFEEIASHNIGGPELRTLKHIFMGAKKRGKLVITPQFFQTCAVKISRLTMMRKELLMHADRATQIRMAFGNHTANIDPSSKPMAFITAAVAHCTGHSIESLYQSTRSRADIAAARMAAYRLIHELCPGKTVIAIGHHFHRDHSTVLHGIDRAKTHHVSLNIFNEMIGRLRPYFPETIDTSPEPASVDGAPQAG